MPQCVTSFNKYKLFNNNQYGFRKGLSKSNATIKFLDLVNFILDKGNEPIGTFLDLSNFDRVDHHILLIKFSWYGFGAVAYSWFESYLYQRSHYVAINQTKSNQIRCEIGIPRGSILGLLLYIIYVNNFSVQNSITDADDT